MSFAGSWDLIEPLLADDALLADIEAARVETDKLHLWWLGQSGFLTHWGGRFLLFDPYLSESLTAKYAATDRPHVRMTRRPIDPSRLGFVDVVTSSHNHTDHLDAETLRPILAANPRVEIVVGPANQAFAAERLGVSPDRLRPLDVGQNLDVCGFQIHAVPAAHESLDVDERGSHRFLGYVVRAGSWTIYHSGDTIHFPGMAERLRDFEIDVAILPINGRDPARGVAGNLWGREAAQLAHDMGARLAIPCHYEMFTFNTASTDEFVATANAIGQRIRVPRCGERSSSNELSARKPQAT
jgi:L-ascorbate metabolism protein UlaG (beta-lactamase superfamily)